MIEQAPKFEFSKKVVTNLQESEILSTIKSINDDYLYWDKVKYKKTKFKPHELWNIVKLSRLLKSDSLAFGNYTFKYVNTDYIQKVVHFFDMNIGGYMGAKNIIPEEDKTRYLVSSIMEEAISSSQIEGANTTRKHAKEMLRKEIKPHTKSEQMIVNNYLTIKHITQNKLENLTPQNLLEIHRLISKDTLETKSEEGAFRTSNDIYVVDHLKSEVVHTPPHYKEVPDLINELCVFFNEDVDKDNFIHPLLKGIIIHFMIGFIHPFTDGNGRTARALFYWYLLKKGYWLTEYLSISKIIQDTKNQYEKAFIYTENDENDLSYFITYNLKVMEKAFEALKNYIQEKQKNHFKIARFIKIPNINERQAQLLKLVYDNPEIVFNTKEIENRFNVSNYTARTDLKGLVELGFLEIIPVNKVKRNFIKSIHFNELLKKHKIV
ncbi:Fic family protein [Tamlana sp. s12]|uniref:Fic family protein n=1 Tax=Pseudotamlana haliotis TaxID=2614804 RepID=A0A6N6MDZ1_9FLAO|nr:MULTISPECIES: Fic family protein [Tamlana]KAB1068980.1 Fic family protein [Tamlana haliotis]OBQ54741.1 cell filamentation protein Fic [Tamlana sp. s12]QQY82232.1 Fic family protein [Tamlana sp. s12]